MRSSSAARLRASAVVVAALALAVPARADILILESGGVPGIKAGDRLTDDVELNIPSHRSVQVMLPSGTTQDIAGPFRRFVGKLSKGEAVSDRFIRTWEKMRHPGEGDDAITRKVPGPKRP